jgi:hypothetical protein
MNKLSLFAVSVSVALVCTAVPASFNWSPAKMTLFSLDTAEAQEGVSRRVERRAYRRAAVGVGVGAAGAGAYLAASDGPRSLGVVVAPGLSATVVDPATGRWCTIEPSGWHWCWRP